MKSTDTEETTTSEPAPRRPFKLGDEAEFCGIQLRLSYVNVGKRRMTFAIIDDSIKLTEPSRNPIAGIVK